MMKLILNTILILIIGGSNYLLGQTFYENKLYGFKAEIPSNWVLFGEVKNDTLINRSIVEWGLPKIYSELESTEIENSISVTAFSRIDIKNIDDLIKLEFQRTGDIILSKDSIDRETYIINFKINENNYKSKIKFNYTNGIGYIITFTSTADTYANDIPIFEEFNKKISFYPTK